VSMQAWHIMHRGLWECGRRGRGAGSRGVSCVCPCRPGTLCIEGCGSAGAGGAGLGHGVCVACVHAGLAHYASRAVGVRAQGVQGWGAGCVHAGLAQHDELRVVRGASLSWVQKGWRGQARHCTCRLASIILPDVR